MADFYYYNLNMVCSKINPTDPDVIAQFNEYQSTNLVDDGTNYYFSIVRFTLSSNNIPILIPSVTSGDTLSYGMMMNYNNGATVSDPTYLQYVCRNKYGAGSQYYWIFNIQDVVDMVNVCFASCMSNITGKNSAITAHAPKMVYNAGSNTFSIYYDSAFFGNNLSVFFNDDLYNLFRNFNMSFISNGGFNYQMIVSNKMSNTATLSGVDYLIETQNYPSISNWSPVSSIQFISNIGVLREYISDAQILNGSGSTLGTSSNQTQQIITDLSLPIDNPMDYNSFITYSPSTFRYSVLSNTEIRQVDMLVYWKDKYGKSYSVMLSDGDYCTVKIMFRKKTSMIGA